MKSDFLFVQPSFISGAASAIDLEGMVFYNESDSTSEADQMALRSDWQMVASDMREALAEYGKKQKDQ